MNIEDMIMSGASEEEIAEAIAQIKAEKAAKDEAERKKAQEKISKARQEELKAEARAYLVNSLLAYSEAFGWMTHEEIESIEQEEIELIEEQIKGIEALLPFMIKSDDIDPDDLKDMFRGMMG